jgi:hypothetical protein
VIDYHRRQIVLTHWNAGVFKPAVLPQLLPELAIYSLLYDEVLIREEDLLTNRAVLRLLDEELNFAVFAEFLISGLVRILRLPLELYPSARRFDPVRLPISARVEEHELRRSYKGNPWKPTKWELRLFQRLDEIVAKYPSASRFHAPFPTGNLFAAQLGDILENRESYQIGAHPVFGYLSDTTADQFAVFCRDPEAWQRFLHDRGVKNPIVGPDAGFFRSAAYQCSNFLPTRRAIRRLFESVYAATYCERESSDGRYGGSELVELPYRYPSEAEHAAAAEDALRIEVAPTQATATVRLEPGIAAVLVRTRQSPEFETVRRSIQSMASDPESPLLAEVRFREAWRNLCAVYAENLATSLEYSTRADSRVVHYSVYAYILARVLGLLILPVSHLEVAEDAAVIAAMEKLGPSMIRGFRALVKIPVLQQQMEAAAGVRCSTVPLTIGGSDGGKRLSAPNSAAAGGHELPLRSSSRR